MTNGDVIRSMSNPALAMWITQLLAKRDYGQRIIHESIRLDDKAAADNLRWLESKVDDKPGDIEKTILLDKEYSYNEYEIEHRGKHPDYRFVLTKRGSEE